MLSKTKFFIIFGILLVITFIFLSFYYLYKSKNLSLINLVGKNIKTTSTISNYKLRINNSDFFFDYANDDINRIQINLVPNENGTYKVEKNGAVYGSTNVSVQNRLVVIDVYLSQKALNEKNTENLITYLVLSALYSTNNSLTQDTPSQSEKMIGTKITAYLKNNKNISPLSLIEHE